MKELLEQLKALGGLIFGSVASLREAASGDFKLIIEMVEAAIKSARGMGDHDWFHMTSLTHEQAVIQKDGHLFAYPYTLTDDNQVALGDPTEVLNTHEPLMKTESVFVEAVSSSRYLVCVIETGQSLNGVLYPPAMLRESAPMFENVRVFVKGDVEHLAGRGKDVRQLLGRLTNPRFIEAGAEVGLKPGLYAEMDVFESDHVAAKLREAVEKNMQDIFGLSIDATGKQYRRGKLREAKTFDVVHSVDLIIEPGAGGRVIRFVEAKSPSGDNDMTLRERMLEALKKKNRKVHDTIDHDDEEAVLAAYTEACGPTPPPADDDAPLNSANDGLDAARMVECRMIAREQIAASKLPDFAQKKLLKRFTEADARYTEADIGVAIKDELEYLSQMTESGSVLRLGGDGNIEAGDDIADKTDQRLDDLFDPSKPARSFREAYIEITGDRGVTGRVSNCDTRRMAEALANHADFREAISASTFADALGNSITRAMQKAYQTNPLYSDWRFLVDVVPVADFRLQERLQIGGYGNLPFVGQNGAYDPLTSPGDDKATYALRKRGGTETISLETVANDDVGALRRIPVSLANSAARTLYEFILTSLISSNPEITDEVALFHASRSNLATAALSATTYAAARLAMIKQTEPGSSKTLGLIANHLIVPPELEETAYNMFVRTDNNDESFVQSRKPTIHVAPHLTDVDAWFVTADKSQIPLIEMGFYNGEEEPELFVQDNPTQGSLFSNDQLKYKIRHIYSGQVMDPRGFYGSIPA